MAIYANGKKVGDFQEITIGEDGHIGIGAALERIEFDGSGNRVSILGADVGIGTPNAAHKVHIEDSSGETLLRVEDTFHADNHKIAIGVISAGGFPGIWFNQITPTVTNYAFLAGILDNTVFNTPVGTDISFRVDNVDKMSVNDVAIFIFDGIDFVLDVGIGTKIGTSAAQKLGLWGATPIVQPSALTVQLTSIIHTAPGTPDYALQDLVDSGVGSAFGFATKDEGNTLLSVVANLQARVAELETKLQAIGALA